MKIQIKIVFLLIFLILVLPVNSETISEKESNQIIQKIRTKYIPLYKKYKGFKAIHNAEIKEIDPKNNQQMGLIILKTERTDFFYEKTKVKALKYIKNGQELSTSKFKGRESKPEYHVFDENGEKNYKAVVVGFSNIENKKCYKVKIIPLKTAKRYIKGFMHFDIKNLDLLFLDAQVSKISFPIKELEINTNYTKVKDLPVPKKIKFTIRVYVPFVQPDRRFISESKIEKTELILN